MDRNNINPFGELTSEEIQILQDRMKKKSSKKSSGRKSKRRRKQKSEGRSLEEIVKLRLEVSKTTDLEKIRIREALDDVRDQIIDQLDLNRLRIYVFYHRDRYMIRTYMKLDGRTEKSHVFPADGFMESENPLQYIVEECDSDLFDYEPRMRKIISDYRNLEMDSWEFVKTRMENSCLMSLLEENPDLGTSTGEICVDIFTTIRRNLHNILKHK